MFRRVFIAILLLALLVPAGAIGQSDDSTNAEVAAPRTVNDAKSELFLRFAEMVDWPESRFRGPGSPILIGILGNDTFDGVLEKLVKGKTIHDRPVKVAKSVDMVKADSCHILFVDSDLQRQFRSSLLRFAKRGILTVGEWDGFTADGGIIGFVENGGEVSFEIHPDLAKSSGLKISPDLLAMGTVVHPDMKAQK